MERWQNRVAVITGASSGIGAACTKLLVAAGLQVVGLARRSERLEQLWQSLPADQRQRFHQRTCDVSAEAQVNSAFEWIEQHLGGVDVLINNAGIVREGQLLDMPTQEISDIMQTNLMGAIYCTKLAEHATSSDGGASVLHQQHSRHGRLQSGTNGSQSQCLHTQQVCTYGGQRDLPPGADHAEAED